jgi:predicted oxidoreductase
MAGAGAACRQRTSAGRAGDADALVTVYVPARMADQVMGPLQAVAARHRWALSIRTDSGARADADLTISDSAGRPVARVRAGSAVEVQARQLAKGALP